MWKKTYTVLLISLLFSKTLFADNLSVYKITTPKGAVSDQDLSVLASLDQSGNEDNWSTYIEAKPNQKKFVGVFYFKQATAKQWKEIRIDANTLGEAKSVQRWRFQLRDFEQRKWITLGDNSGALDWVWFKQRFTIKSNIANYINANNDLKIRYVSNNNVDVSNIDQLSLALIEKGTSDGDDSSSDTDGDTTNDSNDSSGDSSNDTGAADWWQPSPAENLTWQWQINGELDTSLDVDMYDVDLFDTSAASIAELKASGKTVICYFSAGTYEGWRDDWQQFFSFISNEEYSGDKPPFAANMADWDERWLDIRRIDLLAPIMRSRMALAVSKGCDGVEPDNMDAYTNSSETKLNLTYSDQLTYNRWIAEQAHLVGLSVGLKNNVEQLEDLVDHFDWALNEQCFQYNECEGYSVFTSSGKAVFGVEYKGSAGDFCAKANSMGLSWLKKRLALDSWRIGCEEY